ncbi:hypothetical protein JOF36_007678 [Pseudonocardia parietis]|uniref:Uncharacterized protein n=1 Tax=Pseudonocardia parietis TaxID=570936 RepID=A0ABS4W6V5_9PSEU|nr:hypothetical protein [Pseudonocardia parietis]
MSQNGNGPRDGPVMDRASVGRADLGGLANANT